MRASARPAASVRGPHVGLLALVALLIALGLTPRYPVAAGLAAAGLLAVVLLAIIASCLLFAFVTQTRPRT